MKTEQAAIATFARAVAHRASGRCDVSATTASRSALSGLPAGGDGALGGVAADRSRGCVAAEARRHHRGGDSQRRPEVALGPLGGAWQRFRSTPRQRYSLAVACLTWTLLSDGQMRVASLGAGACR